MEISRAGKFFNLSHFRAGNLCVLALVINVEHLARLAAV
jgi:hypothetical protein